MASSEEKLYKPKPGSSWEYMKKVKDEEEKIVIFIEDKANKIAWWFKYPKGKEWCEHIDDKTTWYRRTKDGRESIKKHTTTSAVVPLFCPACGRAMNREEDTKAYNREGHCFFCHIHKKVAIQGTITS